MAIPTETLEALRGVSPEVWAVVPPVVAAIWLKFAAGLRVTETTIWRRIGGKLMGESKPLEVTEEGLRVEDDTMAIVSFSDEQIVSVTGPKFSESDPYAVVKNEWTRVVRTLSSGEDYRSVARGVMAKYIPGE